MIKKRFSFNFREAFASGKPNPHEVYLGHDEIDDEYSLPPSPYSGRRTPLEERTEEDLRLACASIVTNTIPSDAYIDPPSEEVEQESAQDANSRPESEQARSKSLSNGQKTTRNFSNPAANVRVPDFPLPSSFSAKKAHRLTLDSRALTDPIYQPQEEFVVSQVQHRVASYEKINRGTARIVTTRSRTNTVSIKTNVPPASIPPGTRARQVSAQEPHEARPQAIRSLTLPERAVTEPPQEEITAAPIAAFNCDQVSDPAGDEGLAVPSEGVRGRERRSWYQVFSKSSNKQRDGDASRQPDASMEERDKRASRPQSRRRSLSRSVREYIRPGSTDGRSRTSTRRASRDRSRQSRSGSTSSRKMQSQVPRFTWKSWRQSWGVWNNDTASPTEFTSKANKRKSMPSLKSRLSMNFKDLPPLPSLDLWKDQPQSPAKPTTEKRKHIVSLWNRSTSKRKSTPPANIKIVDFRKSMEIAPSADKAKSAEFRKKVDYRKSYSDLQTARHAEQMQQIQRLETIDASKFESPILPHVMAQFGRAHSKSPKLARKPVAPTKSTPTDSVMEGQEVAAVPAARQLVNDISGIRSPPPTDPLPPTPVQAAFPVDIAPESSDDKVEDKNSDDEAAAKQAKRRSSNYSWLPVESYLPPPMPQRRPSRINHEHLPMGVPSAIPGHMVNQRQSSTTSVLPSVRSVDLYNQLQSSKYQYAEDIEALAPPPVPPKDPSKKKLKLPWERKKPMTWMDELEKLGVKDGMLMVDQLNGPPIVRY